MCIPTTTKSLLSFTVANDTNKLEFKADSGRMIKSLILNLQESNRLKKSDKWIINASSMAPKKIVEFFCVRRWEKRIDPIFIGEL